MSIAYAEQRVRNSARAGVSIGNPAWAILAKVPDTLHTATAMTIATVLRRQLENPTSD